MNSIGDNNIDGALAEPRTLEYYERIKLQKLRLAAEAILEIAEDDTIPGSLESELYIFRDRVDLALLQPETARGLLPGRGAARSPEVN